MDTKLIFVTGGVVSSLGKGITAAALGRLLKARGYSVSIMKLDPYLNVDPGTMNPYQHGEVFVTDDGAETDLDIGHYERFINEELTKLNNTTTGQIYSAVLDRERRGGYQGGTVQVIPHITDEIKLRIKKAINAIKPEIMLVEIGGTVGDIESQPFLEAIRQLKTQLAQNQCCFIHVTLIPYLSASGELKTKPTQHSVKELQSIGIQPDVLVCRSDYPLDRSIRAKIGLFCNVAEECVIENLNARSLYDVPLMLEERGLCSVVLKSLRLNSAIPTLRIGVQWLNPPSSPPRNAPLLSSANTLSCTMLIFPLPKHWNTAALQTMQESTLSGSRQKSLSTMIRTQSLRMWTAFLFPAASANAVLKA